MKAEGEGSLDEEGRSSLLAVQIEPPSISYA